MCERGIGDKNRRISGTALGVYYWDRMAGHAFDRADYMADGGRLSRA
jgi:hypothetical protein